MRAVMIWAALLAAITLPIAVAANSPLLAWREPIYIGAGFAGVIAMALLLLQPLLVSGRLPGFRALKGRRVHRWVGVVLVLSILIHVGGLWITSPGDVIDALTFTSPTPFSAWGVIAMWAVFAAALMAALRRHFRIPIWRALHGTLAIVTVLGSIIHALLIEGTMGTLSKVALCVLVLLVTAKVMTDLRVFAALKRNRT